MNTSNNLKQSNPTSQNHIFEEEAISLMDVLMVLANQIKVILITPIILCILTIVYVLFFADPVYLSTSKIMSSTGGGTSQAVGIAAQLGISLPVGQSDEQWVYPEIIKSRTLAKTILKRKFDTEKFGPQKSMLQILTYGNEEPQYGKDTLEILAVDALLNMINVTEDNITRIYSININANESNLALQLNKAFIEELEKHQKEYNNSKTGETRKFIEERILDTEIELNTAEEVLKDFKDRNRRIQNSPSLLLDEQRLSREVAVLTSVFTTLKQQLETAKIEEVKDSDYVVVLDPPELPLFPYKPKKKQTVIFAGLLGIVLGIIVGFSRVYFNNQNESASKNFIEIKSIFFKKLKEMLRLDFK